MSISNFKSRLITSLALLIMIYFIFTFNFLLLYFLLVFGTFAIIEFFNISKKIKSNKFINFTQNLVFVLFVFLFCSLFFLLTNSFQTKVILFIFLLGCVASDIGGFVVGKIFKGPKLTNISPKKTLSGAFGSILFSIIVINLLFFYIFQSYSLNLLLIAIFTSIGCQLGDLVFSFLKRKAKIKDTGKFLPGHGGVLDRLDGILVGVPVGLITSIKFI